MLITLGVIAAVGGVAYASADHPPTIDGKNLVLEFEIRIPPSHPGPDDLKKSGFEVSLFASSSDNHFAQLRLENAAKREGELVIPGSAFLYSQNAQRWVSARFGNEISQVFELKLPRTPRKTEEFWSDWLPAAHRSNLAALRDDEKFSIRYRVQPVPP